MGARASLFVLEQRCDWRTGGKDELFLPLKLRGGYGKMADISKGAASVTLWGTVSKGSIRANLVLAKHKSPV
jgi:hypothetical protein